MPKHKATGSSFAELCAHARQLPGVEESTSYGTPALKVRGKLLARLWEDGDTLVIKCDDFAREALMQLAPNIYFITDHYRGYPYLLVRLSGAASETVKNLLTEAWRAAAPKHLLNAYREPG